MTSNVDGMFVRAGFREETVYEVHGSRHWSQCLAECGSPPFPTPPQRAATCPACGATARPNVLMFADFTFDDTRRARQWAQVGEWFDVLPTDANVVVLELGAGTTVPTVRRKCETLAHAEGWPLIRVNTQEQDCLTGTPVVGFVAVDSPCEVALANLGPLWGKTSVT